MKTNFSEQEAQEELKKGYKSAEKLLADPGAMEKFLQRLEKKLKLIPLVGDWLATLPVMISLLRSFVKKEYTDIPIGSVIAIISALLYFLSPIDAIPDAIPLLGYLDDAAVVAVCWKLVESDVAEYTAWRKANGLELPT